MALRLRHDGPPPPDATVLLHMGAGRIDDIVSAAIRSFDDYAELGYDPGLATASVFAELDGVDRAEILAALPHSQFAVATVGVVRPHFWLLATSSDDPDMPRDLVRLQPVHFDVVLLAPPHPAIPPMPLAEAPLEALAPLREALAEPAATLADVFTPRRHKPDGHGG